MATDDVVYRGIYDGQSWPGSVMVEKLDGTLIGPLVHVVRHSRPGFSWGYGGSGPHDLARLLLIAALGDERSASVAEAAERCTGLTRPKTRYPMIQMQPTRSR